MADDTPSPIDLRRLRKEARERFLAGRRAETQYSTTLRKLAKQIDMIVRGIAPEGVLSDPAVLIDMLRRYAETITPWAEAVAKRMVSDVSHRDAAAWVKHGQAIGQALKQEIDRAPIGAEMGASLARQVRLIRSIPLKAAERVHKLTLEAITTGRRASEIAKDIMASGEVSKSRAMLIARTEVSRTATALTQARAQFIGSTSYIWRTAHDGDVRPSHKAMEGQAVPWNDPPVLDNLRGHAGELPNCRCFCEPILPDREPRSVAGTRMMQAALAAQQKS